KYGLISAPARRISTRVDFLPPGIARTAVVRLSMPHVALTGAHAPGTVRLYEFTFGQKHAINSGTFATRPAMYCCMTPPIQPASSVAKRLISFRGSQRL